MSPGKLTVRVVSRDHALDLVDESRHDCELMCSSVGWGIRVIESGLNSQLKS
jgi:hypothetical protein